MTQIKLRRDTSANLASANHVLGVGEPAYETDTKKLKIGDGTTAYTQLEYFTAGGGSTDITATLDELGNEVNGLSGRVAAAEADIVNKASKSDLDKKENKITTTGALTLTEKIISNLNGMSLTADGAGVYSTSGTHIDNGRSSWRDDDRIIGSSGTSGYFVPGEYTADSWRGGYIDMPYTFGYTMKMPGSASIYGYAGKYDAEGRFIPIIQVGYSHNGKSILYSDSLTLEKESGYDYTILRGQASAASGKTTYVSTSGGRSNSGWTISDKSYQYLQWYVESNGTVTQIQRDGQTTDARFYVATSASAAVEAVARWKEVTVIRFAPTYNYRDKTYGVSANPFPAAEFGVYPTDKKIYEYASEADLIATGNLFDLSGQTAHNYLELNIGSGLAITDGKLHANLDELDNKVNDLSGRVTTAEADILTKQDILTPIQPLTIQNKIISNLVGMEYTGDGTGIYGAYSLESGDGVFESGNFGNNTNFGSSWTATSIPCYIDIPYTFGQIVKIPSGTYGYTWNKSIGKLLADGTFIPICNFYPSIITTSDTLKSFTQYRATWDTKYTTKTSGASFSVANGQAGCSYIQFIDNGSTIRCLAYYGNGGGVPSTSIDYTVTDNNDIQRIREIQVVRVFPNRQDYGVSSNPYPVDRFGLYDGATTLDTLGDFNNLGENLFDLSGQVARNYLEVQVDGTTITTNSSGQLQANVPSNLTTQGNTFNGANQLVKLDSSGKLPAIDGSNLTNLSGGSAPTNMVTTDTSQTITGIKTFEDKIVFNRPEDDAAEQSSIFGGEFKLGTPKYNNSIYANQLLLNANTTNAGTFKVQTFSTHFTQINGATITSQRTGTGAYKIINTIRPSGDSSNKNYSVLYSEVDDSYNHKLTINNLSSDLVLAGKTIKDGSGNEFITGSNFITFCQNNADAIKAALGIQ